MSASKSLPILGIISPCYNEEALIEDTVHILSGLLKAFIDKKLIQPNSFIVFIDDGSRDNTFKILGSCKNPYYRVIKLTSNRGHQHALLAGLQYVLNKVDCVISIDADLQDDLDVVEQMIIKYTTGFDIICGVRSDRTTDSIFKRISAKIFYRLLQKMKVEVVENHADFRLLSNKALVELDKYKERNLFLRGIFPLIKLPTTTISYIQKSRSKGKTKYNTVKMATLAVNGITSFTNYPIRIITLLGLLVFIVTVILSINVLVVYMQGKSIPGWASIALPLYFLGGVQLLCLGVIGEYIAKTYNEVKQRPLYHIEEILE